MGATIFDGPLVSSGNMAEILSAPGQGQAGSVSVPDPNTDRGPSLMFQGIAVPDIRFTFGKDKVQGYTGMVPGMLVSPLMHSINQIPMTADINCLAAAQAQTINVAMTFEAATAGVDTGVPIVPFAGYGGLNGATVVTAAIALDFGFAYGTVVAASKNVTVADSALFFPGMPLVIAGCGNAAGTIPLLTNVDSITSATVIVILDAPLASLNPAPIGTGNLWGPSEVGAVTPTAAMPYLAGGPGLFLDPRQTVARSISIATADGGGLGGTWLVTGYDVYGMLMSELVTVAAAASIGYSTKAFKYLMSIVPQQTDPALYYAGTADNFGFCMRLDIAGNAQATWNLLEVDDGVGFQVADQTNPATTTTDDVRGTVQVGVLGAGTPLTNAATSNGTIAALVRTGRRLILGQYMPAYQVLGGRTTDTRPIYGVTQV